MRILFVDDDQDTTDSFVMLATMLGHEATVADTSAAALDMAATSLPDIIFIDIWLRLEDGREVARLLRQIPALSQSKLIALTGTSPQDHDCEPGLFDEILLKPITLERFQEVFRPHIEQQAHSKRNA